MAEERLDLSALYKLVQETEQGLQNANVSSNEEWFGHPPPPQLVLSRKDSELLILAFTKRTVALQLWLIASSSKTPPRAAGNPLLLMVVTATESLDLTAEYHLTSNESIACATLLRDNPHRFSVVLGTNASRVLTLEGTIQDHRHLQLFGKHYKKNKQTPKHKQASRRPTLGEPLPLDRKTTEPSKEQPIRHLFCPVGGVASLSLYTIQGDLYLWISYHDGTLVRIHQSVCFPSQMVELDAFNFIRAKVQQHRTPNTATVLPLPVHHDTNIATPLVQVWKERRQQEDSSPPRPIVEAISFGANQPATMTFLTSEQTHEIVASGGVGMQSSKTDSHHNVVLDVVMGVGSVLGGFLGLHEEPPNPVPDNTPLSYLHKHPPQELVVSLELDDEPRQLNNCTIDPSGTLAAAADNLGRILLVDLTNQQIIRLWKGFRDASCYWWNHPTEGLYLVLHSRQRRVVEVYKTKHKSRAKLIQVHREAQVVTCQTLLSEDRLVSSCYLLQPHASMQVLQSIELAPDAASSTRPVQHEQNVPKLPPKTSSNAAIRLQRLQQLLAHTNVPCQPQDVFDVLQQITSLVDLAAALDLLAVAPALEEKMGVVGSGFYASVLEHCQTKLDAAIALTTEETTVQTNPHVQLLSSKLAYYSQMIKAYNILNKFETSAGSDDDDNEDKVDMKVAPRSAWSVESVGWTHAYEKVTGNSVDADTPPPQRGPLGFATFARACAPQGDNKLYLSDSSKTRRQVLRHIFKPLLRDIFAFKVVDSIFDAMGIRDDFDYLLQCFGEWFMTLSAKETAQKALFALYSPMLRWLQEIVGKQLDTDEFLVHRKALKALLDFCRNATDLLRAFMLATMCREAVANGARQKEEKTYGIISSAEVVKDWDAVLRQIRVCLLVSLRLHGIRLGAFPITVETVDQDDIFSVYEWLAHDELQMSYNHKEIVSLETACKISGLAFDASSSLGDDPSRTRALQRACIKARVNNVFLELKEDDNKHGALLLYLSHYNDPPLLLAHRALILSAKWGQNPGDLGLLDRTLDALKHMSSEDHQKALTAAVRLEVWQTRVRPIYRAHLFGFDDVQELSEVTVGPLIRNPEWMNHFGRLAVSLLSLLSETKVDELDVAMETSSDAHKEEGQPWPPLREDFILKRLVAKSRPVNKSSLEAHHVTACAMLVSTDIATMADCVPGLYDSFLPSALFDAVSPSPRNEKQQGFLEDSVIAYAQQFDGPAMHSFDLENIDFLAATWGVDMKNIRSLLLLAMYEFGKDALVDELVTTSGSQVDIDRLVRDGINIICRRLHDFMKGRHTWPAEMKNVLGMLDADVCEWVREQADRSQPLVLLENLKVPIGSTHLLAMRLLCLAVAANAPKQLRAKIHSLIVVSGTLAKAWAPTSHASSSSKGFSGRVEI